jgi:hypothetical protein
VPGYDRVVPPGHFGASPLHIVCRFRFLFIESQSDFYWFNIEGWGTARLPVMAHQLLAELGLMQTEAQDAELHKPGTWEAFVSIADLEAMMRTWKPLEKEIRKLCLRAMEPGAEEARPRGDFVRAKRTTETGRSAHHGP